MELPVATASRAARFTASQLERMSSAAGVTIVLEPADRSAGYVLTADGHRAYFHASTLDLNGAGAASIADDKEYAAHFLKAAGYPVPATRGFDLADAAAEAGALDYARERGFPVVVKPNGSRGGRGVSVVESASEFPAAFALASVGDVVLVQEALLSPGLTECRVVTLDDNVLVAYTRSPLGVTGDGVRPLHDLLDESLARMESEGRSPRVSRDDPRVAARLRRDGLSFSSVPANGQHVRLMDCANLSVGGSAEDVTDSLHPALRGLAVEIAATMSLRYCGIDLVLDGTPEQASERYWVLEVNAAPGLYNYSLSGPAEAARTQDAYRLIIRALATLPR